MSVCLRSPWFVDRLWTWADDHESITENMHSLRTDVIIVLPSNKEFNLHTSFPPSPTVHFSAAMMF